MVPPGREIHVHQAVVDAKVLDMEQMVVGVEVPPIFVGWFLSVAELVVEAELEHQPGGQPGVRDKGSYPRKKSA